MNDAAPPDGITDPFELARQERWLDLARLGKKAWNTWAEEEVKKPLEERAEVDFSGQEIDVWNFSGFVFPGHADFDEATFSANANFREATFSDYADFRDATFSDYADFSEATFSDYADFIEATFSADTSFREATFSANADFREATFSDYASFSEATFSANADFREATFSADAVFVSVTVVSAWNLIGAKVAGSLLAAGADIKGHAYFSAAEFLVPPDFTSTGFTHSPVFLGTVFRYPTANRLVGKCSVRDGEARFRRLKQLAADAHDHEMELALFAFEIRAKRFHSQNPRRIGDLPRFALSYIYEWFSNFGQSWVRPFCWLLLTVITAAVAFETLADGAGALARGLYSFSATSWIAAGLNVFPFAGQAVIGREVVTRGLCPVPEGVREPALDCLTRLYAISAVEGVFALIFLFLIGLGLRNRFRIK